MTFHWPLALWAFVLLPVLPGVYLLLLRRKAATAFRYPALATVREALGPAPLLRRHLPPVIAFLALATLLLAGARPTAVTLAPAERGTIILLMDVSLSMAATDVPPTRLAAAQAAARSFIDAQPEGVLIGIVAFAGHAEIVQRPTADRLQLMAALAGLRFQRYTSLGNGLTGALLAIDPTADPGGEYDIFGDGRRPADVMEDYRRGHADARGARRRNGYDFSTAIVLVSDGQGATGVPHTTAARMAVERGVRVYTIGIGTLYGGTAFVEGMPPLHAEFEEETLRSIANVTGGEYFSADSADKVKRIYEKLSTRVIYESRESEITALFSALGATLWLVAATLSLAWLSPVSREQSPVT